MPSGWMDIKTIIETERVAFAWLFLLQSQLKHCASIQPGNLRS
jgi:hypothetical protein